MGYCIVGALDTTDRIMNDTFWIGVYPDMNDEMIDKMIETVQKFLC
jgi:CDP-6-deoxy-D-xylo-4-hexulose-3-dehydrase